MKNEAVMDQGVERKAAQEKAAQEKAAHQRKIVVRSHSHVIYYYPTILMALFCGFMVPTDGSGIWGGLFLTTFFLNTVVVLFDFTSLRTLFLSLVAAVIGLIVWHFGLDAWISQSLSLLNVRMNAHAFYTFAVFFGFLTVCDVVWSHLNRWEFSANEIKHIQAFAGHTENFPGRGVRFRVVTEDVFERLILGCSTVILTIGKKQIRLENVVLAHRKVRELERFIRSTGIFDDSGDVFDEEDED